jgi:signal transduction histidine kinase
VRLDRTIETGRESSHRAADHMAALGEMTGGITHDFRNILAVIDAGVSVAERHADEPDQVRLCLAGVHDGVRRGLNLTSRLLGFVKEQDHAPRPRNVNDLLEQLQVFLRYGAGPDVRVVFELAPAIPSCVLDAAQFNAAILNLVINARDAMSGGGVITIETSVEIEPPGATGNSRALVHVSVSDTGHGMSRAVLRKVFDPYFTTKGEAGTGLGVPQVCAFVQRIGGHIDVKSALGKGTTFDLAFPVEVAAEPVDALVWRQVDRWVNEGGAGKPRQRELHPSTCSRDRRRSPSSQAGGRGDRKD